MHARAAVDEPGNTLLETRETLKRQDDGSLLNEVFYRFRTSSETCTEEQRVVLTRSAASTGDHDPQDPVDEALCIFDDFC